MQRRNALENPKNPPTPEEQAEQGKVQAIRDHFSRWEELVEEKIEELFQSFGNQPLTNKTFIVGMSMLLEHFRDPDSEAEPFDLNQDAQDIRNDLLVESVWQDAGDEFGEAWWNARRKKHFEDHYARAKERGYEGLPIIERYQKIVEETPLPPNLEDLPDKSTYGS